jgi:hypothetical protein
LDCDNHEIVWSKIEFYDISSKANNVIKFYLTDRFQRALIDYDSRKYSFKMGNKLGFSQSSILGPLFFLLHINNLPEIISDISNPVLFADDTSMTITNSEL